MARVATGPMTPRAGRRRRRRLDRLLAHNRQTGGWTDVDRHLVISGVPRGGTTWLAELLLPVPRTALVWEPLHPHHVREYPVAGFHHDLGRIPYVPEDADWEPGRAFFDDLFRGRFLPASAVNNWVRTTIPRPGRKHRWVYKMCRANLLLPWLVGTYPLHPIYLVRHPLAVISSQFRHEAFDDMGTIHNLFELQRSAHSDVFERYDHLIGAIDSRESMFANWWAITNVVPLTHPANNVAWLTVSYERLLSQPHRELDRIAQRLDVEFPPATRRRVRAASAVADPGIAGTVDAGRQLAAWRARLTAKQVAIIMEVVHSYGIDAYSLDAEPDYRRLGYRDAELDG